MTPVKQKKLICNNEIKRIDKVGMVIKNTFILNFILEFASFSRTMMACDLEIDTASSERQNIKVWQHILCTVARIYQPL